MVKDDQYTKQIDMVNQLSLKLLVVEETNEKYCITSVIDLYVH